MHAGALPYLWGMRGPLVLLAVLWVLAACAQPPLSRATWTFGISLATGQSSELYTLFLVKEHGGEVLQLEPITREQFMLQVQGAVPSKANPEAMNLFRRYGVERCLHPDSTKGISDCDVLDELWKLRFWEYPFHPMGGGNPVRGWAEKREAPSPRQLLLLSDYGIRHVSGLARGEDAFRLLRDVGDPEWVDNYRQGY